jgi:hypothetical protein
MAVYYAIVCIDLSDEAVFDRDKGKMASGKTERGSDFAMAKNERRKRAPFSAGQIG